MSHSEPGTAAISIGALYERMPVTARHWQAGLVLFMAFVIESWEMMTLILCGPSVTKDLGIDYVVLGSLLGALFFGMIPGAFAWAWISDRFGRRASIMWSLASYGAVSLASSMAPDAGSLWTLRFICGFALAGVLVNTFPYFEELLPAAVRGKAAVYLAAGWPLGLLISIGVVHAFSEAGWRWTVRASSLTGLWAIAVWLWVPESPYWLQQKGRLIQARDVIRRLWGATWPSHHDQRPIAPAQAAAAEAGSGLLGLFRGHQLRVTLLQTVVNFTFSWGYWALTSWMPTLLAKRGLDAPQGLGFMALSALFMFPGYIAASFLTGRWGRKRVMVSFVACAAICGFGLAASGSITTMMAWNFGLSFFSLGAWGVWNTWMGELYGTELRAIGYGWGIAAQRVANAIAPAAIGAVLATQGYVTTVTFIAAFLAATVVASAFIHETEGTTLE
ncbi:MFS transporter [Caldimonas sp. KR1-144]|uniref:MFS transporter n=1 Tax=Caldimonas sp. KR1-144 TaxID=3400911 RepID=UPI003BFABB81